MPYNLSAWREGSIVLQWLSPLASRLKQAGKRPWSAAQKIAENLRNRPLQAASVVLITAVLSHRMAAAAFGREITPLGTGIHLFLLVFGLLAWNHQGSWQQIKQGSFLFGRFGHTGDFSDWDKRVTEISGCRICQNRSFRTVIDLGPQSLACLFDDGKPQNQLTTPIPLHVVQCDPARFPDACGFVQLKHTVPPDVMFRDYGYRSGVNTTMKRHLQELVREIEEKKSLQSGDIVIDIGANDGTTLLVYRTPGIVRVGFEPSDVRPETPDQDLCYIPSFFNTRDFQKAFPGQKAKIVTAIAMFYDLDDPAAFCRQVDEVLADDGFWVVEMGYWGAVLDNNGFDSICHEHLGYYSLGSLKTLFEKTGFCFYDVAFNSSNGGSVRCTIKKQKNLRNLPEENLQRISEALRQEKTRGYDLSSRFEQFRRNSERIREDLRGLFENLLRQGKSVYGYGASTKGNVLLQYVGLGPQHLVAIADRNPAKWRRLTPGTHIPICSEDQLHSAKPDYLLILPWHFLSEFLEREEVLRSGGTRFIVPFPEVRVV